jgi:hypothetical protein
VAKKTGSVDEQATDRDVERPIAYSDEMIDVVYQDEDSNFI